MNCIMRCLRRRLGLFVFSILVAAIVAIGAAWVFVAPAALAVSTIILAAIAGGVGGAAVTISSCARECRGR